MAHVPGKPTLVVWETRFVPYCPICHKQMILLDGAYIEDSKRFPGKLEVTHKWGCSTCKVDKP